MEPHIRSRDPLFPAIHNAVRGRTAKQPAGSGDPTRPRSRRGVVVTRDAMPDAYLVLGIDASSTLDEVRAAYRRLARRYHPDRFGEAPEDERRAAEKRMSEINAAYTAVRTMLGNGEGKLPTAETDETWFAEQRRARRTQHARSDRYRRWDELERLQREGRTADKRPGWWAPRAPEPEPLGVRLRREREARRAVEAARWANTPELQDRVRERVEDFAKTVEQLYGLVEERIRTGKARRGRVPPP